MERTRSCTLDVGVIWNDIERNGLVHRHATGLSQDRAVVVGPRAIHGQDLGNSRQMEGLKRRAQVRLVLLNASSNQSAFAYLREKHLVVVYAAYRAKQFGGNW